jgi:hypothetical protein
MHLALRWLRPRFAWAVLAAAVAGACTGAASATDLHPEGPPMVEQVRLAERYSIGTATGLDRVVFGFGTYPGATAAEEHPVTSALASGNKLRIIMDELLRGNDLEEIACRTVVDDDVFARVPLGATPDDIARCAVAQSALAAHCPASNPRSVCICARDGGCPSVDGTFTTPRGQPVGVSDTNMDGAADRTRFIAGAVGIRCGAIDVPIDLDMSFWTPSGNQQVPALDGFDALGPAIVLVPGPAPAALPTSTECGVVFAPDVVDKDGNRVCAPQDGDIATGCTPGDTTAVRFTVEPMAFAVASVVMDPGQSRTADVAIRANAPLDPASIANVTVTEGPATSYTQFTATLGTASDASVITIRWTATGGLAANTSYTITVPTTVTDAYHQPAKLPFQIAFTTGAT